MRNPSELKNISFKSQRTLYIAISIFSSTTFYWYLHIISDCRNLNRRDLLNFPILPDNFDVGIASKLEDLGRKYITKLRSTSHEMTKSGLQIETFEYGQSKPIIDEIDRVLAQHYGFTAEELDFIINYDIKYRMGRDAAAGDDE